METGGRMSIMMMLATMMLMIYITEPQRKRYSRRNFGKTLSFSSSSVIISSSSSTELHQKSRCGLSP